MLLGGLGLFAGKVAVFLVQVFQFLGVLGMEWGVWLIGDFGGWWRELESFAQPINIGVNFSQYIISFYKYRTIILSTDPKTIRTNIQRRFFFPINLPNRTTNLTL